MIQIFSAGRVDGKIEDSTRGPRGPQKQNCNILLVVKLMVFLATFKVLQVNPGVIVTPCHKNSGISEEDYACKVPLKKFLALRVHIITKIEIASNC